MLTTIESFASNYVNSRRVDIWLPPGYDPAGSSRYPVIYAHDGQNMFADARAGFGVSWGLPAVMSRLLGAGLVPPAIVVGVWNTAARWREYVPAAPFAGAHAISAAIHAHQNGPPLSDHYLRFLVEEVKPYVDANFATVAVPHHTFVMGSSMGGLCSAYALCRYPDVFGGAACLSTHWPVFNGAGQPLTDYQTAAAAVIDYFAAHLPPAGKHRLYFDCGTAELDAYYPPFQAELDRRLPALGYRPDVDWVTRVFAGAAHNESAWRQRLPLPLGFLLTGRLLPLD